MRLCTECAGEGGPVVALLERDNEDMISTSGVDATELLLDAVSRQSGARVIDIGCGGGQLAKRLAQAGAIVACVDPDQAALAVARRAAPKASFHCGMAEALAFEDRSFDFTVLLNSLHHVSPHAMDDALREAVRVTVDGGRIFVIEPGASGPLFEVLKLVDDESVVRRQAQDALTLLIGAGAVSVVQKLSYERRERFDDLDQFIERIAAVESSRREAALAHREELRLLFLEHGELGDDGRRVLAQPMTAIILTKTHEASGEPGSDGAQ